MIGKRFGRFTVAGDQFGGKHKNVECVCDCGEVRIVRVENLLSGNTKSCGCLARDKKTSHGQSRTSEYCSYHHMIQRCINDGNDSYVRYGGRGVRVCDRWLGSFELFLSDMGMKPTADHTIERIDNDGHYEPGNCIWATREHQNKNTSRTVFLTFNGTTKCLKDWAADHGIPYGTLRHRIKNGWSTEKALTTDVDKRFSNAK